MIFFRKNNVELEYQSTTQFTTLPADLQLEDLDGGYEEIDDLDSFDDEVEVHSSNEVEEYLWYVVDLTNRKLYGVKDNHERAELEWHIDVDTFIEEAKEDCVHTLKLRIENNRNVIYTATQEGNQVEIIKAKNHMERNHWLIDFTNNYSK